MALPTISTEDRTADSGPGPIHEEVNLAVGPLEQYWAGERGEGDDGHTSIATTADAVVFAGRQAQALISEAPEGRRS